VDGFCTTNIYRVDVCFRLLYRGVPDFDQCLRDQEMSSFPNPMLSSTPVYSHNRPSLVRAKTGPLMPIALNILHHSYYSPTLYPQHLIHGRALCRNGRTFPSSLNDMSCSHQPVVSPSNTGRGILFRPPYLIFRPYRSRHPKEPIPYALERLLSLTSGVPLQEQYSVDSHKSHTRHLHQLNTFRPSRPRPL